MFSIKSKRVRIAVKRTWALSSVNVEALANLHFYGFHTASTERELPEILTYLIRLNSKIVEHFLGDFILVCAASGIVVINQVIFVRFLEKHLWIFRGPLLTCLFKYNNLISYLMLKVL